MVFNADTGKYPQKANLSNVLSSHNSSKKIMPLKKWMILLVASVFLDG